MHEQASVSWVPEVIHMYIVASWHEFSSRVSWRVLMRLSRVAKVLKGGKLTKFRMDSRVVYVGLQSSRVTSLNSARRRPSLA